MQDYRYKINGMERTRWFRGMFMACSCLKVILGWSCVAQSDTGVPALIGSWLTLSMPQPYLNIQSVLP